MATNPTDEAVAARVSALLREADISPLALTRRTGIAYTTLLRRLTGGSSFTIAELEQIGSVLDRSISDFLAVEERAA